MCSRFSAHILMWGRVEAVFVSELVTINKFESE